MHQVVDDTRHLLFIAKPEAVHSSKGFYMIKCICSLPLLDNQVAQSLLF